MSKWIKDIDGAVVKTGANTNLIHADEFLEGTVDVAPPIHVSTTFRYSRDPEKLITAADSTVQDCENHIYSRVTAPNTTRLEAILSSHLKGYALVYGSGLSALHAAFTHLNPKRLSIGGGYHGSHGVADLFTRLTGMKQLPLDCPAEELGEGDLVLLETPVNPYGEVFDIEHYVKKAHSRGAKILLDATFAPPPLLDPFKWGIDMIMHSATKYIGGHSDLLGGVLVTQSLETRWALWEDRIYLGSMMGGLEAWLGVRSLRTMELRVRRQSENATKLVTWMNGVLVGDDMDETSKTLRSVIGKLRHASLQTEPWVKEQMPNGYGPVFAIEMKAEKYAKHLPSHLSFFAHATSLGGVESLIEWRAMSDTSVSTSLLRVSVGCEDYEDLRQDLEQAFLKVAKLT